MPTNSAHYRELSRRLEACADRLCDYQDRLRAGTSTIKSIEYDRLLDTYRAELIRYDRIDRELSALEEPTKTKKYVERQRICNQLSERNLNY